MSNKCRECGYDLMYGTNCPQCGRKVPLRRSRPTRLSIPPGEFDRFPPGETSRRFLLSRGLSELDIVSSGAFESPRLYGYVFFPVIEDGEMVSWQARYSRGDDEGKLRLGSAWAREKWQSPSRGEPWLTTKRTVWNLDSVLPGRAVYVCEGIFDAMYFRGRGVALMGWRPSEVQALKILDRLPSRVILALDSKLYPDGLKEAGWAEAEAIFRGLDRNIDIVHRPPPALYKDYGEMVRGGSKHESEEAQEPDCP